MRRFGDFHPLVILLYYISAIVPAMLVNDWQSVLVSWLAGFSWLWLVKGRFPAGNLFFAAAAVLVTALINALVSHGGETELFFINNKAVTLEAVRYGALSGLMLTAVLAWFASFSEIMTGDKIIALFARFPKFGLMISMVLRLVPEYTKRFRKVRRAAKINSADEISQDTPAEYLKLMSAVFTWALENSMQTADAMRLRGYPSDAGRYSPYRFRRRDGMLLAVIIMLQGIYFLPHGFKIAATAFGCAIPIMYSAKESLKWVFFKQVR